MTPQPSCRGTTGTALPSFLSPSAKLGVHLWAEDALTRTREEGILGGVLHPSQEGPGYAPGSLACPAAMQPGERGRVCLSPGGKHWPLAPSHPSAELPDPEGLRGLRGPPGRR